MDDSVEQRLGDFLEQARIKSKEFYLKAAQSAVEQAYEGCREAIVIARKATEQLPAPSTIKEALGKEDAEKLVASLKEVGADVEMK